MISIKQRQRFKDITWLMPSVDIPLVLERLGLKVEDDVAGQIWSYCPDHHLYTGHRPSDPKWAVNKTTGETLCFTEGRGSNLVWTVKRVKKFKSLDETVKWITGIDSSNEIAALKLASVKHRINEMKKVPVSEKSRILRFAISEEDIEEGKMFDSGYEYFMHPPGKSTTNIRKETVDKYNVIQRTWGFYSNRVVVPFLMKGIYRGFVAIDILGSKEWMKSHPEAKKYNKTRYPPGFSSINYLFGYDDVQIGAEYLIITEGAREVMKLWQEGFTNSVAVLKSSLADNQVTLLSELAPKKLVLMFDGDEAGENATEKVMRKVEGLFKVCPVYLPSGVDPKAMDGKEIQRLLEKCKIQT